MRFSKNVLIHKAQTMDLSSSGSKLSIAKRIASAEENDFEHSWRAIVDRTMTN